MSKWALSFCSLILFMGVKYNNTSHFLYILPNKVTIQFLLWQKSIINLPILKLRSGVLDSLFELQMIGKTT